MLWIYSQLKSSIIKGLGHPHISQLEKSFQVNDEIFTRIKAEVDNMLNNTREEILSVYLEENEDAFSSHDAVDAIYQDAEGAATSEAHRLARQTDLAGAVALLKIHGFIDVADNMMSVANEGTQVAYLHQHFDELPIQN